jgi:hypothetical protein
VSRSASRSPSAPPRRQAVATTRPPPQRALIINSSAIHIGNVHMEKRELVDGTAPPPASPRGAPQVPHDTRGDGSDTGGALRGAPQVQIGRCQRCAWQQAEVR